MSIADTKFKFNDLLIVIFVTFIFMSGFIIGGIVQPPRVIIEEEINPLDQFMFDSLTQLEEKQILEKTEEYQYLIEYSVNYTVHSYFTDLQINYYPEGFDIVIIEVTNDTTTIPLFDASEIFEITIFEIYYELNSSDKYAMYNVYDDILYVQFDDGYTSGDMGSIQFEKGFPFITYMLAYTGDAEYDYLEIVRMV